MARWSDTQEGVMAVIDAVIEHAEWTLVRDVKPAAAVQRASDRAYAEHGWTPNDQVRGWNGHCWGPTGCVDCGQP